MLMVLVGYVVGSVPIGLYLARRWGRIDPRRLGSGNPGATNVYRVAGWGLGAAVMGVDVAKGVAAVWLAARGSASESTAVAAGVAAVVGHVFPVWLRGSGGKGVATACGAFSLLAPVATALAVAAFAVTVGVTRLVSAGSLVATVTLPSMAALGGASRATTLGACAAAGLVMWRHRANIARLMAGTEPQLGHQQEHERA